jgi:hypothetical protein
MGIKALRPDRPRKIGKHFCDFDSPGRTGFAAPQLHEVPEDHHTSVRVGAVTGAGALAQLGFGNAANDRRLGWLCST